MSAGGRTGDARRRAWGEPPRSWLGRLTDRMRVFAGGGSGPVGRGLPELPVALRRTELAPAYLTAAGERDHRQAARVATEAMESALELRDWWPADIWAHRALWHHEQAEETLEAVRMARRIGELRLAAGDPMSARRYYAEAIDEARDIGAEHEQGLAALGLGRSLMELGEVTTSRRLASAATDLLHRAGAPAEELAAARDLLGSEVTVGEHPGETEERT